MVFSTDYIFTWDSDLMVIRASGGGHVWREGYDFDSASNTDYGSPYSGSPPQPPPTYYQSQQTSGYGATTVVVGQPMPTTYVTASVNDYMGLATFACLCCCWPLGLVAIFKANECRESLSRGDVQSAILKSSEARIFSLISIFAGVLIIIGTIVAIVIILQ